MLCQLLWGALWRQFLSSSLDVNVVVNPSDGHGNDLLEEMHEGPRRVIRMREQDGIESMALCVRTKGCKET